MAPLVNAKMNERKLDGEEAEASFLLQAIRRGLRVAKPHGDSSKYDLIVDSSSRLSRVQVKSAANEARPNTYNINLTSGGPKNRRPYSCAECDFIAAYIKPLDIWYILPMAEIAEVTSISFNPLADNVSKYNQYEGAWHLFN